MGKNKRRQRTGLSLKRKYRNTMTSRKTQHVGHALCEEIKPVVQPKVRLEPVKDLVTCGIDGTFTNCDNENNLVATIGFLRSTNFLCDVMLRTSAPQTFCYQVHSLVLCARSVFFKSLFETNFYNGCRNIIINLPSYISNNGLEEVIAYMYHGELVLSTYLVGKVFSIAWLFRMPDVMKKCQQFSEKEAISLNRIAESTTKSANPQSLDSKQDAAEVKHHSVYTSNCSPTLGSIQDSQAAFVITDLEVERTTSSLKLPATDAVVVLRPSSDCTQINQNEPYAHLAEDPSKMIQGATLNIGRDSELACTFGYNALNWMINECQNLMADELPAVVFTKACIVGTEKPERMQAITIKFPQHITYPSPVLYMLHATRLHVDSLIHHEFLFAQVRMEGQHHHSFVRMVNKMQYLTFGHISYVFLLGHTVTTEDVERFSHLAYGSAEWFIADSPKKSLKYSYPTNDDHNKHYDGAKLEDENETFSESLEKQELVCPFCTCKFQKHDSKSVHIYRHHRDKMYHHSDGSYRFVCQVCGYASQTLRLLYFHRYHEHKWNLPNLIPQFRCGLCFAVDYSFPLMEKHIHSIHGEVLCPELHHSCYCDLCGKQYNPVKKNRDMYSGRPLSESVLKKSAKRNRKTTLLE